MKKLLLISLLLLRFSLFSQEVVKTFPEKIGDFAADNEENLLVFLPHSHTLQKLLSAYAYDSVLTFSGYENLPLSKNCRIAVNTRQEIYVLDSENSRLIVLSKDLRPLTAVYWEKGDLQGIPWEAEISCIAVSVKGFVFLADTIEGKIYVLDNFWKKNDETELRKECRKLLVFEDGKIVCKGNGELYFPLAETSVKTENISDIALYNNKLFLLFPDGIYEWNNGQKRKVLSSDKRYEKLYVEGNIYLVKDKSVIRF